MKYLIILLSALALSGCLTTLPVNQQFPDVPKELLESCPELKLIEGGTTTLSKLLETVVQNYTLYHRCAANNEAWSEWYNKQREIFNNIGK